MSKVYAPWSRLTLYRGQWLVMQSNVDEASARVVSDTDVYAQSHVAVPNSVAAAAPDMLEALRSCEANLRLIHEAAGPVPRDAPMPEPTFVAWKRACAAIAKAEGR